MANDFNQNKPFQIEELKMQKVIIFIEHSEDTFTTDYKLGNLFANRFAIDEEAGFEVLKVFELGKTSAKISMWSHVEYINFAMERKQKGLDHFIAIDCNGLSTSMRSWWARNWST